MRRPAPLRVRCVHLESAKGGSWRRTLGEPRQHQVRLNGGGTRVLIHFCTACAERMGVTDGRADSLRLAALIVLHRELHSRLATIVEALGEIAPLLTPRPQRPDETARSERSRPRSAG